MAKKQSPKVESDDNEVLTAAEEVPETEHAAYSVFKDKKKGRWLVVRVKFVGQDASEPEVLFEEIARDLAVERFKIEVAKNLLS